MKVVTLEGWLVVIRAMMAPLAAAFGSDEASKFIDPFTLWICRNGCGVVGIGIAALKGYRSTSFSEYKASGHTDFITKANKTG